MQVRDFSLKCLWSKKKKTLQSKNKLNWSNIGSSCTNYHFSIINQSSSGALGLLILSWFKSQSSNLQSLLSPISSNWKSLQTHHIKWCPKALNVTQRTEDRGERNKLEKRWERSHESSLWTQLLWDISHWLDAAEVGLLCKFTSPVFINRRKADLKTITEGSH